MSGSSSSCLSAAATSSEQKTELRSSVLLRPQRLCTSWPTLFLYERPVIATANDHSSALSFEEQAASQQQIEKTEKNKTSGERGSTSLRKPSLAPCASASRRRELSCTKREDEKEKPKQKEQKGTNLGSLDAAGRDGLEEKGLAILLEDDAAVVPAGAGGGRDHLRAQALQIEQHNVAVSETKVRTRQHPRRKLSLNSRRSGMPTRGSPSTPSMPEREGAHTARRSCTKARSTPFLSRIGTSSCDCKQNNNTGQSELLSYSSFFFLLRVPAGPRGAG